MKGTTQIGLKTALALIAAAVVIGEIPPAKAQLLPTVLQQGQSVDAVVITVDRFGPSPDKLTRAAGPFVLLIVNGSGSLDDIFSIVKKPGGGTAQPTPSLLDLRSTRAKQRDHQLVQPAPGEYQILFRSHPSWKVDLTITPQ